MTYLKFEIPEALRFAVKLAAASQQKTMRQFVVEALETAVKAAKNGGRK